MTAKKLSNPIPPRFPVNGNPISMQSLSIAIRRRIVLGERLRRNGGVELDAILLRLDSAEARAAILFDALHRINVRAGALTARHAQDIANVAQAAIAAARGK